VPPARVVPALCLQHLGQILEARDPHRETPFNGRLGHAENHARFLALRHGVSPRGADFSQSGCPVFSHAGHQYGHGLRAKLLGYAVEQHIHRRAMPVHRGVIPQHRHVAQRQFLHFHVPVPRTNQRPSGICCTTRMLPEKSVGRCENRYCKAFGPPVETPMATMCVGATGRSLPVLAPWTSPGRNCACTPALCAAAWIFLINSAAISGMCAETSCGLATKSNAPSPSALNVIDAPVVLCELTTITGSR